MEVLIVIFPTGKTLTTGFSRWKRVNSTPAPDFLEETSCGVVGGEGFFMVAKFIYLE